MFQKQRTILYLGEGRSIDSLGVIFLQTINGLTVNSLDEYSALKSVTGWYVEDYHVPAGVVEIGQYAFNNCQFLEEIVIPDSVTYVDSDAFYQCKSLKRVTLPNSMGLESPYMDHNPFFSNEELYKEFLDTSLDSLECIYIPKDKREMLSTLLPHLTHLFVDK